MRLFFITVFAAIPSALLAHPGDHGGFDAAGFLAHLMGYADHAVLLMLGVAIGLGAARFLHGRRT